MRKRIAAWLKVKAWLLAKIRKELNIVVDMTVCDLKEEELEIFRQIQRVVSDSDSLFAALGLLVRMAFCM